MASSKVIRVPTPLVAEVETLIARWRECPCAATEPQPVTDADWERLRFAEADWEPWRYEPERQP